MNRVARCTAIVFARAVLVVGLGTSLLSAVACTTYRDHLNRGQRYYDENDYEKALALWRALEPDMDSLSDQERARYSYLRGMTDYRLGYRSHARHWLAVAQAIEKKYPGGLEEDWHHRAKEAIEDLNKDVFGVERFDTAETPATSDTGASAEAAETVSEPGENAQKESAQKRAEPAGPKACRTDSECSGDQVCISRKCVSP
jgi:hypothetical protein